MKSFFLSILLIATLYTTPITAQPRTFATFANKAALEKHIAGVNQELNAYAAKAGINDGATYHILVHTTPNISVAISRNSMLILASWIQSQKDYWPG